MFARHRACDPQKAPHMTLPNLSRRSFLHVLALGAGTALVGCAQTNPSPATAGEMREIIDRTEKPVQVPVNPQRIVTLSEPTLDGVLALGVEPIGVVAGRGLQTAPEYLSKEAGHLPIYGNIGQPNFEIIGAGNPDLILVDGTGINNNEDLMAGLRAIAPTVVAGYAGTNWRDNFTIVADALNMQEQGQAVMDSYDQQVAEIREELGPYMESTFSVIRWQGNSASMILKELPAGIALTDLGLRRPPAQDRNGRAHSEPVSLENLADIDADYMFFGTLGGSSVGNPNAGGSADTTAAKEALRGAAEVPGFSNLHAYQQQHILPVSGSWTSTGGPLLMRRIVEDVRHWMVEEHGTFAV